MLIFCGFGLVVFLKERLRFLRGVKIFDGLASTTPPKEGLLTLKNGERFKIYKNKKTSIQKIEVFITPHSEGVGSFGLLNADGEQV